MTDPVTDGGSHASPSRPIPNPTSQGSDRVGTSSPDSPNVNQGRTRQLAERAALIEWHIAQKLYHERRIEELANG